MSSTGVSNSVCVLLRPLQERVVGLHVMCPNAGEVIQGFAAALRCGLPRGSWMLPWVSTQPAPRSAPLLPHSHAAVPGHQSAMRTPMVFRATSILFTEFTQVVSCVFDYNPLWLIFFFPKCQIQCNFTKISQNKI